MDSPFWYLMADIIARAGADVKLGAAAEPEEIICFLHYPPLYKADEETIFTELFAKYGVAHCVFGHIHGQDAGNIFEGETRGVTYKLVSCDTQNFMPQLVLP